MDIIWRILVDIGLIAALAVLMKHFIKKWISESIEHRYKMMLEERKASLEIEKATGMEFLRGRNAVFPEIVELVYRLRNHFRLTIKNMRTIISAGGQAKNRFENRGPYNFGPELSFLTDNLYKYSIFLGDDVFQMIHKFKRNCQDAAVLLDRITRDENLSDNGPKMIAKVEKCKESIERLEDLYQDVNDLYPKIREHARRQMKGILEQSLDGEED